MQKHKNVFSSDLVDAESDMAALLEFAAKIPVTYGPSQESGLEALARTFVVNSPLDGDPVVTLIEYLNAQVSKVRRRLNRISKPKPQVRVVEAYLAQNRRPQQ